MSPRPSLDRLRLRPHAADWEGDELVTLAEAAALLFPNGPVTTASLRIAHHRGALATVDVSGRLHTTLSAVRHATSPRLRTVGSAENCGSVPQLSDELRRRLAAAALRKPPP